MTQLGTIPRVVWCSSPSQPRHTHTMSSPPRHMPSKSPSVCASCAGGDARPQPKHASATPRRTHTVCTCICTHLDIILKRPGGARAREHVGSPSLAATVVRRCRCADRRVTRVLTGRIHDEGVTRERHASAKPVTCLGIGRLRTGRGNAWRNSAQSRGVALGPPHDHATHTEWPTPSHACCVAPSESPAVCAAYGSDARPYAAPAT